MNSALKQLRKPVDLSVLTPAAARVEIARDVLAALDVKKLKASAGTYFAASFERGAGVCGVTFPLRENLPNLGTCEVCALGACFTAIVARKNEYEADSYAGEVDVTFTQMASTMAQFFSRSQIILMEAAFERTLTPGTWWRAPPADCTSNAKREAAMAFGDKYRTADPRMRAIMQNVIDNNGTFVP